MKMYESYEAFRDPSNKCFESQDGALISYFLPHEYPPGDSNVRTVDYMLEFRGTLDGVVDSTAATKQLIFKTEPDERAEDWKKKELKDWSSNDVLHWIASVADSQKFPYEFINANAFNIDGKTLLSFSKKEFVDSDEKYGCLLYRALHKYLPMLEKTPTPFKSEILKNDIKLVTLSTSTDVAQDLMSFASKSLTERRPYGLIGGPNAYAGSFVDSSESYPFELNPSRKEKVLASGDSYDGESKSGRCLVSSVESRPHKIESKKKESRQEMKIKRSPGRPPGVKTKKDKPEKKTGKLWEFIRDLLLDPQHCPSVICWENYDDGVFRFVKSEKVAKIWGDRKGNEKMNYEKLSRAMRYYYRSKVLQPVLGRRLVYKFGPTAKGWKTENPNFRH